DLCKRVLVESAHRHPIVEKYSELIQCRAPVWERHCPSLADIFQRQVHQRAYFNNNWLHTQTLANGAQTTYSYNALGQVLDLVNEQGSLTLSDFQITHYDGAGNRTETAAAFPQLLTLDGST